MSRWLALLSLAGIALAGMAHAADLAGIWSGIWTKAGDDLTVVVTFERSQAGFTGSFESHALGVVGIPFQQVATDGRKLHFVLAGDESTTTFDGTLKGDRIDGTLVEGGTKGTFYLVRVSAVAQPIHSRDVTFASGGVTLAGTLIEPTGGGPYPAIVFLHGSGGEGRWANHYLAESFANAGFAALITDKRGAGQSTGRWQDAGFEELAGDAAAGIRFMQSQQEIDGNRIGIYGHSQGGTLAPLVAVRSGHVAFVIAAAAGGINPAEMEEYSVGNSIGIAGLSPAEAADASTFVRAIVDVAYRGKPRAELDLLAAQFKDRAWYFAPPPSDNSYWSFSRRIAAYEPATYWRQVKVPVMLLFGERDKRVPAAKSSKAIVDALHAGGNAGVTLHIIPKADHTFSLPSPAGGWPRRVEIEDVMTAWARASVRQH